MTTDTASELSNRTITDHDISRAAAILDVDSKTRALMKLVPKAGMGAHEVSDPSGWSIRITRGEVGCGDAHRFHVAAKLTSTHLSRARTGRVVPSLSGHARRDRARATGLELVEAGAR